MMLDVSEFNHIKNLKSAHEIWEKLMEIHEGTAAVKNTKLYVFQVKVQLIYHEER